jgi:CheY-like chemotaxis protein
MRILFIDDEPIRIRGLQAAGHQVFLAHGFDQIDAMLHGTVKRGDRFDLICCDHDMPLMDGRQVVDQFLKERGIPVVVHSLNIPMAQEMTTTLLTWHVPAVQLPCTDSQFVQRVTELAAAPTAAGRWIG